MKKINNNIVEANLQYEGLPVIGIKNEEDFIKLIGVEDIIFHDKETINIEEYINDEDLEEDIDYENDDEDLEEDIDYKESSYTPIISNKYDRKKAYIEVAKEVCPDIYNKIKQNLDDLIKKSNEAKNKKEQIEKEKRDKIQKLFNKELNSGGNGNISL